MEEQHKRGVKLGLFITIGLVFFMVGILAIGNINKSFTRTIIVTTIFDQVGGLQPGDNVWFSGVKVGTVKDLHFLKTTEVEVTMKIETKSQEYIPKNAKAKVGSDGLIGHKIIVIYEGSADAGHIMPGDKLIYEKSYSTEDMMDMLQENNKNILAITNDFKVVSSKIANGEGSLGKLLTTETLYNNLATTISTLKSASDNAVSLTASIATYAKQFNTKGGLANTIATDTALFSSIQNSVAQLNAITTTASSVATNLDITTQRLNTDKNTPVGVLLNDEQVANSLKISIQNLENSTQKLNESMEALQSNFLLRGFFRKQEKEAKNTN